MSTGRVFLIGPLRNRHVNNVAAMKKNQTSTHTNHRCSDAPSSLLSNTTASSDDSVVVVPNDSRRMLLLQHHNNDERRRSTPATICIDPLSAPTSSSFSCDPQQSLRPTRRYAWWCLNIINDCWKWYPLRSESRGGLLRHPQQKHQHRLCYRYNHDHHHHKHNLYIPIVSLFFMGFINNTGYVLCLAAAHTWCPGATAMVFLSAVLPSLTIKCTTPILFHYTTPLLRWYLSTTLMVIAFLLFMWVQYQPSSPTLSSSSSSSSSSSQCQCHSMTLVGVSFIGMQCGLGEATMLGFAGGSRSHTRNDDDNNNNDSRYSNDSDNIISHYCHDRNHDNAAKDITSIGSCTDQSTPLMKNIHDHCHNKWNFFPLEHHNNDDHDDHDDHENDARSSRLLDDGIRNDVERNNMLTADSTLRTTHQQQTLDCRIDLMSHNNNNNNNNNYRREMLLTAVAAGTGMAGPCGFLWYRYVTKQNQYPIRNLFLPMGYAILATLLVVHEQQSISNVQREHNNDEGSSTVDLEAINRSKFASRTTRATYLIQSNEYCPDKTPGNVEGGGDDEQRHLLLHDGSINEMGKHQTILSSVRIWFPALVPYALPLFLVYFAEYACQAGTWTAIGFTNHDSDSSDAIDEAEAANARNAFYQQAGSLYQLGVWISRSSGIILHVQKRSTLWIMSLLQVFNLIFFTTVAAFGKPTEHSNFAATTGMYNITTTILSFCYRPTILLPMCFFTGLLGGGVYIQGFQLLSRDWPKLTPASDPARGGVTTEVALATTSTAEGLGIVLADVLSLFIQSCLYARHQIPGAAVSCPFQ
jgi:hypothetical protein